MWSLRRCGLVALVGCTLMTTATATASAREVSCGDMHIPALRHFYSAASLRVEHLFALPSVGCRRARMVASTYYVSHAPAMGSGLFRHVDGFVCGGGQSGALGGVPLTCYRIGESEPAITLRARPLPRPPSLGA